MKLYYCHQYGLENSVKVNKSMTIGYLASKTKKAVLAPNSNVARHIFKAELKRKGWRK